MKIQLVERCGLKSGKGQSWPYPDPGQYIQRMIFNPKFYEAPHDAGRNLTLDLFIRGWKKVLFMDIQKCYLAPIRTLAKRHLLICTLANMFEAGKSPLMDIQKC